MSEATPQPENIHPAADESGTNLSEVLKNFMREHFTTATDEQLGKINEATIPHLSRVHEKSDVDWDEVERIGASVRNILQTEDSAAADGSE